MKYMIAISIYLNSNIILRHFTLKSPDPVCISIPSINARVVLLPNNKTKPTDRFEQQSSRSEVIPFSGLSIWLSSIGHRKIPSPHNSLNVKNIDATNGGDPVVEQHDATNATRMLLAQAGVKFADTITLFPRKGDRWCTVCMYLYTHTQAYTW
ncbi:hypothetical protein YC2023_017227 [Brassica napus]